MRLCTKCKRMLNPCDFPKHNGKKSRSDNLDSWCKECHASIKAVPHDRKVENLNIHRASMAIKEISDTDAAYLAGIIDGEGSINLFKNHSNDSSRQSTYCLRLRVTNTFKDLLDWLVFITGFGSVRKMKKYAETNKEAYEWYVSGRRAANVIRSAHPFLKIKKMQADIALEFEKTIGYPANNVLTDSILEKRRELRDKMTGLNR